MKIVKCGTDITTKLNNINGIITAACIRFNAVNYEVSYFNNGEYKQIWLSEAEFQVSNGSRKQIIGFNK